MKLRTEIENPVILLEREYGLSKNRFALIVDPAIQVLFVVKNRSIITEYPISTSKVGLGCAENSHKTPIGVHRIRKKIGFKAKIGAIFRGRRNIGEVSRIYIDRTDIEDDFITSRILWLEGLEKGINKGKGVDTFNRFIYIHGTPEEGLIGEPHSHGCIRLKNRDVIELFNQVSENTLVYIINREWQGEEGEE